MGALDTTAKAAEQKVSNRSQNETEVPTPSKAQICPSVLVIYNNVQNKTLGNVFPQSTEQALLAVATGLRSITAVPEKSGSLHLSKCQLHCQLSLVCLLPLSPASQAFTQGSPLPPFLRVQ